MRYTLLILLFIGFGQVRANMSNSEPIYTQNITLVLPISEVKNVWQTDVKGEIQLFEDHLVFLPKRNKSEKMVIKYQDVASVKKAFFVVVPNHLHLELKNDKTIQFFTYKRKKLYHLIQSKL